MENLTKDAKKLAVDIAGMQCAACEHRIERAVGKIPGVVGVLASQKDRSAEILYFGELDVDEVQRVLKDEGYTASLPSNAPSGEPNRTRDYVQIGAVFAVLAGAALLVQHLGLVPKGFTVSENTGYGLAFLIGLAASVTSCMAVTGGLLIALAAKYNEANAALSPWRRFKPHLAFNVGRILSYGLLGGAVGALGSALTLSPWATSGLIVASSVLMVVLGLQMLKLLPAFASMRFIPKSATHRLHDLAERNSGSGAFLLGALTFFLPCGFTQALQLYVLAQGSFVVGAVTMFAFALGTLPALLSISALSSFARGAFQKHVLRFAGVAVILLGFLNIQYGLVLAGSNAGPVPAPDRVQADQAPALRGGKQIVEMRIDGYDYIPNRFTVRQGVPVEWRIDARDAAGCGRILLSRSLRIQKFLSDTEVNVIAFTPEAPGQYSFNCGMGMMTPGSHFTVLPGEGLPGLEKI